MRRRELGLFLPAAGFTGAVFALAVYVHPTWGLPALVLAALLLVLLYSARRFGDRVYDIALFANILVTDLAILREQHVRIALDPQVLSKLAVYSATAGLFLFRWPFRGRIRGAAPVMAYVALCTGSIVYSSDASFTLACAVVQAIFVGLAMALVSVARSIRDLRRSLLVIAAAIAVKCILSWFALIFAPSMALTNTPVMTSGLWALPRLAGIANPNAVAFNATVLGAIAASLLAFGETWRQRLIHGGLLVLAVGTTIAAQGRSSLVGLAAAGLVVLFYAKRRLAIAVGIPALLFGLIVLAAPLIGDSSHDVTELLRLASRTGEWEEVETMAGRTEIWQQSIAEIRTSPLIGHGFGSSRAIVSTFGGFAIARQLMSAHSAWLEALLDTGLVGMSLLAWITVLTFWALTRTLRRGGQPRASRAVLVGILAMFTTFFINGLVEAGVASTPSIQGVLYFWVYFVARWATPMVVSRNSSVAAGVWPRHLGHGSGLDASGVPCTGAFGGPS